MYYMYMYICYIYQYMYGITKYVQHNIFLESYLVCVWYSDVRLQSCTVYTLFLRVCKHGHLHILFQNKILLVRKILQCLIRQINIIIWFTLGIYIIKIHNTHLFQHLSYFNLRLLFLRDLNIIFK